MVINYVRKMFIRLATDVIPPTKVLHGHRRLGIVLVYKGLQCDVGPFIIV